MESLAAEDREERPEFAIRTVENDLDMLVDDDNVFAYAVDMDYIMATIEPENLSQLGSGWELATRPVEGGVRDVVDHTEFNLVLLFDVPYWVFVPGDKVLSLRKQ